MINTRQTFFIASIIFIVTLLIIAVLALYGRISGNSLNDFVGCNNCGDGESNDRLSNTQISVLVLLAFAVIGIFVFMFYLAWKMNGSTKTTTFKMSEEEDKPTTKTPFVGVFARYSEVQ